VITHARTLMAGTPANIERIATEHRGLVSPSSTPERSVGLKTALVSNSATPEQHGLHSKIKVTAADFCIGSPSGENPMTHVSIEEYVVADRGSGPYAITAGTDGGMWFTMNQANAIGRVGIDGTVTVHPLPN